MEKNTIPTPEELAAEQAGLQVAKEDEIRANIIAEYGFDEIEDAERIDKLVVKEIDNSKKLSSAIGQKIKHRTEADELRKKVIDIVPPEPPKKEPQTGELSQDDLIAVIKADIPQEDVKVAKDYAKLNNISVAEALKSDVVKGILSNRAEERATAQAASTGPVKRGSSKASDEVLLEKLDKGELPEEDIDRTVKARIARMKGT